MSHAGRSPVVPRIQDLKGEREYPDLSSRLTAVSVTTTPNRATTEERSAERGKGSYSGPTDAGSKPRKAINQAGKKRDESYQPVLPWSPIGNPPAQVRHRGGCPQ